MLHEIKINFTEVVDEVGLLSANMGASSADAEGNVLYDKVATTKYDEELLQSFWTSALPALIQSFRQFLDCAREEGGAAIFQLNMPGNFNANYLPTLRQATKDFMVNSLLASWCSIKAKAEQEQYAQKAAANLLDINNKLYIRRAPVRHKP